MRRPTLLLVAAIALATTSWLGTQPVAAQGGVVADWWMDEPAGSQVLVDVSGNGVHGQLGSGVVAGVRVGTDIVHRFPDTSSSAPADPTRLHRVGDRDALDPGTGDYSVEVRFRTTVDHTNIIQKGQSTTSGGMWKMEIDRGSVACLFRGSGGDAFVRSTTRVIDGNWHQVRCERSASGVTLAVDGTVEARRSVASGNIANSWDLTIGGKPECNNRNVECDYFRGDIDYARIDRNIVK
jgi:hypothetical protein